ncbi:MAG: hypothetical protein J7502_01755 [Flavisolibacter sp.]|nr:hypothetical protein [Flavisolibacter sp.]
MTDEKKEDYYSLAEIIIQIKSLYRYLLKRWWVLLLAVLAGVALGTWYYYRQKPKYKAEITFILEEKSPSGSGLAGLASQFGFNVGSISGGSMFSGDNILNILTSKKIVEQVLLSPVDSSTTLADFYLQFTGIKSSWKKKPEFANFKFYGIIGQISPVQDSILNDIYAAIVKKNLEAGKVGKQSTIISVKTVAANRVFARLLVERLVEAASKLYLDVKTNNAQANIDDLQRRSDSLLVLLNRKSYTAAVSQPLDFNPGIRSAIVPTEIETRDKTVLAALYGEVTKSLEMSKLMLAQQTPVIQILDRPSILLNDNRKGLTFLIVAFSFVTGLLGLVLLALLYFLSPKKIK